MLARAWLWRQVVVRVQKISVPDTGHLSWIVVDGLTDPAARLYRTRIREAVAKGVGFAGHYEVAIWGCGAACLSFAIVDAVTGKVYFFPATISQVREAGERLTYKRDSRAVHVIGSLNEEDSADRWYVWNGDKFILISKKPAVLVDDNDDPIKP